MGKLNGNMKITTVIVLLSVITGAIAWTVAAIASAQTSADKANVRIDAVECRFERIRTSQIRIEDKVDKVLLELKK